MDQLSDDGLDLLFRQARTFSAWLDKPVSDDLLRRLYDVMKYGPTSANSCPARFVLLRWRKPSRDSARPWRRGTCRRP